MFKKERLIKHENNCNKFSDTRFCLWDVVRDFGKQFKKDSYILDAGCGNGRDSYALSKQHQVTGLDTADYVPESTENCSFVQGDFCSYNKDEFNLKNYLGSHIALFFYRKDTSYRTRL